MASELTDDDIELSRIAALANPDFHVEEVQRNDIIGTHYVHLNNPERVWKKIKPFLEKYHSVIENVDKSRL